MASNPKLDELNKLGLQYFDNWKDLTNAIGNLAPGQIVGGINKKGKLVFHQGGIGEINVKQAKAELVSLRNASAPSQAPAAAVSQTVASQPSNTPVLQGTITQTQPSPSPAAAGVQQNVVIPQQVNPTTQTLNNALKNPKAKSTKKDTTLKTGKRTPASIDRSAAIVKLANNPEAEQEMIDIISKSVGMKKGKSQYNKLVKSAKGTLGKPDPGPNSKQGYIEAIDNRDFFMNEGYYHKSSLFRQRTLEQDPSISKTRLRKLTRQHMSQFSDEALFNVGEQMERDKMIKYYTDTYVHEESERLAQMTPEQRLQVFEGSRKATIRGKKTSVKNISDKHILDLSKKYLKQYERLEVGDSRIAGALAKAGERLRGGIAFGDVTYHPGYSAIESSLDQAAQRRVAMRSASATAAAVDDSAQVAGQISSALSAAGNMLDDSAQAITKVTSKKAISARTLEKLMSSHSVSAGLVAGGAALLYGVNKRLGERQVG